MSRSLSRCSPQSKTPSCPRGRQAPASPAPSCSQRRLPILLALVFALSSLAIDAAGAAAWTQTHYTAQRKPRVTVLEFADTNTDANLERFGSSVSAMLVTYLKRNSQFVVVERQDIKEVLNEWERNQTGMTNVELDRSQAELLEKIDVFITGKVTVLTEAKRKDSPTYIEIDAKLLSRVDGRIITAVQRSGLRGCLRTTVTRLGSAIQQEYLRPHFGQLRLHLRAPEYTHFKLTPVLRNDALAEEMPPVELSKTTYSREVRDLVSPWVTNPTSYTIDNLLSGWYTVRLERPGYVGLEVENARFQAVEVNDSIRVRYRDADDRWIWVDKADPSAPWRKFLVEVKPLRQVSLDASTVGFSLPKQIGSIRLAILDESSQPLSGARVYLRSMDLVLNPPSPDPHVFLDPEWKPETDSGEGEQQDDSANAKPRSEIASATARKGSPQGEAHPGKAAQGEGADSDEPVQVTVHLHNPPPAEKPVEEDQCEHLDVLKEPWGDTSEGRVLRGNRRFELSTFRGGSIAFDNYRGETLPTGAYEVVIWAPHYVPVRRVVHVSDGDGSEALPIQLERQRQEVLIRGRSRSEIAFEGLETGFDLAAAPDRQTGIERIGLPVDRYQVHANLERFGSWNRSIDLLPSSYTTPTLEEIFPSPGPSPWTSLPAREVIEIPLKDEIWIGGRTKGLLRVPEAYYDGRVERALDEVLNVSQATRQVALLRTGQNNLESLATLLEDLDLLILSETDVARILLLDDVARVIRSFVESGRAVLAFVTHDGDYESLFGVPLTVRKKQKTRRKLILQPGDLPGLELDETIDLGVRRAVPLLAEEQQEASGWRILAYAKDGKTPRLLELGHPEEGGYVMVWLESALTQAMHGANEAFGETLMKSLGAIGQSTAQKKLTEMLGEQASSLQASSLNVQDEDTGETPRGVVEGLVGHLFAEYEQRQLTKKRARQLALGWSKQQEANDRLLLLKARIQNRALDWAEHLMYRRLGGQPDKVQAARERITRSE